MFSSVHQDPLENLSGFFINTHSLGDLVKYSCIFVLSLQTRDPSGHCVYTKLLNKLIRGSVQATHTDKSPGDLSRGSQWTEPYVFLFFLKTTHPPAGFIPNKFRMAEDFTNSFYMKRTQSGPDFKHQFMDHTKSCLVWVMNSQHLAKQEVTRRPLKPLDKPCSL